MPNFIAQLGQQAGSQAASSIFGIALGAYNDYRQRKQQEKLQNIQIKGSKELTDYDYAKQLQMWKDTNYSAQVEQMKKAGINPALLYGMSGGGGTTTGNANVTTTAAQAPSGGREIQDIMGMGIQMQLLQAQKRVLETQADKNSAEAEKTKGVDTQKAKTEIQSLLQGIDNAKAQKELTEIQSSLGQIDAEIKGSTQNAAKALIFTELRAATNKLNILENEKDISTETKEDKINIIKLQLIQTYLQNKLTKSNVDVNDAQINQIKQTIAQGWEKLRQSGKQLNYQEWELQIKEELKTFTTQHPGTGQVIGNIIEGGLKELSQIFNAKY